jgi:3-hydroxyacyl-[acyl-carrier-protein] dehydratase
MRAPDDLVRAIPHRPPWLLVDRVVAVEGAIVRAEKRLTHGDRLLGGDGELSEPFVVEALAQTAACLNAANDDGAAPHQGMLVAASRFSFEGPRARAGDLLTLEAQRTASLGALHRFTCEARVDGRVIARGELSFAVTSG